MINLVICLVSLIIGVSCAWYEISCFRKRQKPKHMILCTIGRFFGFFMFGAFLFQFILWCCGGPTIIENLMK
jgi:hypothetical protein